MGLLIKNIRESKGTRNCVIVDVNNVKYILTNMIDRIELYTSQLDFIKSLYLGVFVNIIDTCVVDDKKYLIIISTNEEYCILETKFILDKDVNIKNSMQPLNTKSNTSKYIRNDKCFLYSFIIKNILLLFLNDEDIYCYIIKNRRLIFDDFPNDFKYFRILSTSSDGVYIVFLAKDMQGSRVILKYYADNDRLKLRNRISGVDNIQKKCQHSNISLDGLKTIDLFRNGYLSVGDNFICYEDGDIIQVDFANTYVKSKCNIGNKMLYSMEDGELVQIEILNKKTNKSRHSQSCDDLQKTVGELNPKIEKSPMKLLAKVIDKTSNGYNFMKSINKTTILAGNHDVVELIRLENSKIEVINKIVCEDNIKNGIFSRGIYYIWNHNKIYNVTYSCIPTFKNISKMSKTIHKFMKMDDILILGFYNKGTIFSNMNKHILETERILNILKVMYKDRSMVYFNTPNHIYKVLNKNEIFCLELKNIILSSFKQDKAIFFLNNRNLVLVDIENMKIQSEQHVVYEISTLLISDFILISTFDNNFICLNEDFSVVKTVKAPTFVHSLCFEERYFFSDGQDLYECHIFKDEILFEKIYESSTLIRSLCLIKSSILVVAKESVLINLENLIKDRIKLQDITNGLYDKDFYHFSKGKKLITCAFEDKAAYSCFLYKDLSGRRMEHSEIIGYFPEKQLILLTDKLYKSTKIIIGDTEVGKIQNFFTNNVIELGNKLILSGFTNEKQMVISISRYFEGVISDIKKSNQIFIIHTEDEEVISVHNFRGGFIICNSSTIFVYNVELTKIFELEIDFIIEKVYCYSNYILIIDYFKSFVLLKCLGDKVFEIVGSPITNYKFNNGGLTDKHIILSSGSILFVYEIEGIKLIFQTNIGNEIVYIGTQSLDINVPVNTYIFTSCFSIHYINFQ